MSNRACVAVCLCVAFACAAACGGQPQVRVIDPFTDIHDANDLPTPATTGPMRLVGPRGGCGSGVAVIVGDRPAGWRATVSSTGSVAAPSVRVARYEPGRAPGGMRTVSHTGSSAPSGGGSSSRASQ